MPSFCTARLTPMQTDVIDKIVCSIFFLLSEHGKPLFPRAFKQLRIIVSRTAQRKARPAVSRLWKDTYTMAFLYDDFTLPKEPAVICSTPGCISLDDAKMNCGKCKNRYYCSKECQTRCVYCLFRPRSHTNAFFMLARDWRVHKSECKRSS